MIIKFVKAHKDPKDEEDRIRKLNDAIDGFYKKGLKIGFIVGFLSFLYIFFGIMTFINWRLGA